MFRHLKKLKFSESVCFTHVVELFTPLLLQMCVPWKVRLVYAAPTLSCGTMITLAASVSSLPMGAVAGMKTSLRPRRNAKGNAVLEVNPGRLACQP